MTTSALPRTLPECFHISEHNGCQHRQLSPKSGKSVSAIRGGVCSLCGAQPTSRVAKIPLQRHPQIAREVERLWPAAAAAYNTTILHLAECAAAALPAVTEAAVEFAAEKGNKHAPKMPTWKQMKAAKDPDGNKYIPGNLDLTNLLTLWGKEDPDLSGPDSNRHIQQAAVIEALTAYGLWWDGIREARNKTSRVVKAKKQPGKRTRRTASQRHYDPSRLLKDVPGTLSQRAAGEDHRPMTIGINNKTALQMKAERLVRLTPIKGADGKPLEIRTRHDLPLALADNVAGWRLVETTKKTTRRTTAKQRTYELHLQIRLTPPTPAETHESDLVGIDRGVNNTLATSDGIFYNRPAEDRSTDKQRQKRQSSKRLTNGSRRHKKIKQQRRRANRKAANKQKEWENKTANKIARKHPGVVMEDLSMRNMTASAAGGKQRKGRNVKAKSRLNESLGRAALSRIGNKIDDQMAARGKPSHKVPAHYTSQTCRECGRAHKDSRRDLRFRCAFEDCPANKIYYNADTNGATNTLLSYLLPDWGRQEKAAGHEQHSDDAQPRNCEVAVSSAQQLPLAASPKSGADTDTKSLTQPTSPGGAGGGSDRQAHKSLSLSGGG